MPVSAHVEKHFQSTDRVRDIVIGMSDGLTVPFALAAGMTGAVNSTSLVVTAGMAEIVAGAIAMGLGGFLAARTEFEHYASEKARETKETQVVPHKEAEEVAQIFRDYGLAEEQISPIVNALRRDRSRWVDFMMRFELGLEPPDPARARTSAATIAASYVAGGLIPLCPYILSSRIPIAFCVSIAVTLLALFVFGFIKGRLTGTRPLRAGIQTVLLGGLASSAAYAIARAIA